MRWRAVALTPQVKGIVPAAITGCPRLAVLAAARLRAARFLRAAIGHGGERDRVAPSVRNGPSSAGPPIPPEHGM